MNVIPSVLKFAAGFISNLACQFVRALCNLIGFLFLGVGSVFLCLLSALQLLGGGSKQGRLTATRSWKCLKSSAKMFSFSLLQASGIALFISPLVRGAQACTESISPRGLYAPRHDSLNVWQSVFGLNSWEAPSAPVPEKKHDEKETSVKPKKTRSMKVIYNKPVENEWLLLATSYLSSRTQVEMDAARKAMAIRHPFLYMKTLKRARKALKKKAA